METIATMEIMVMICKIKSKGTSIGSDDTHQPLQNVPRQRQEFFCNKTSLQNVSTAKGWNEALF